MVNKLCTLQVTGGGCGIEELVSHLFFECSDFAGLWYHVCNRLGTVTSFQNEVITHLDQFEGLIGSRRCLNTRILVLII